MRNFHDRRDLACLGLTVLVYGLVVAPVLHAAVDHAGGLELPAAARGWLDHQVTLGGGSFGTWRGLLIASPDVEGWMPVIAGQVYGTNGPFESPERLQRFSLFTQVTRALSERSSLSVSFTSYGSGWNASGQVPSREVRAGRLSRFGVIDPGEGGNSQRHSLYGTGT
jgi:hypothetical protein